MKLFLQIVVKKGLIITFVILLFKVMMALSFIVHAEEIIITSNGSESSTIVNNNHTSTTNVSQSNNGSVNNTIALQNNTGDNFAESNTGGDAYIHTGDTTTAVEVLNEANKNNVQINDCCPQGSTTTIAGNASNSTNSTDVKHTNNTNVTTQNNASIINNTYGYANTGINDSNDNAYGNVALTTGGITVVENITNGHVNINKTKVPPGSASINNELIKIMGNGADSKNLVSLLYPSSLQIKENNSVNILTKELWILNTGKNEVNDNTKGEIDLSAGAIAFIKEIINSAINVNAAEVVCCEEKEEQPAKPKVEVKEPSQTKNEQNAPTTSTTSSSTVSVSNPSSGGSVEGVKTEKILPATGNSLFMLLLLANSSILLLGLMLRLHSGNAPGHSKY